MLLREYLTEYTKEELLDQARSFEIRKCSGLRKADLIDRIVDNFCTEEMLRSRLACLTKEQMDLFRKACICILRCHLVHSSYIIKIFLKYKNHERY